MKKRKDKKIKIVPTFPIGGDPEKSRRYVCEMIQEAPVFLVEAIEVILTQDKKTRQILALYKHLYQEAENVSKD